MARLSDKQSGFTLIEVSTALIFVGFIIFILAATTVNIVRSYNKGIWLAQINQAGQQMNNDIGDKARYSPAATVKTGERRMCINGVSYLWNTQQDIDDHNEKDNVYSDGTPIRLARIDDPNGDYCTDLTRRPKLPSGDDKVHILLGRGATIQEFKVEQKTDAPLLTISVVVSTEGANRPYKVTLDKSGKYKEDMTNGTWQCGDLIDSNNNNMFDNNEVFTPAKNQYCSFAKYTFIVYERSRK
ncbi:MAG: type II secretion system protein [Candidatus Nanoperiomorbus sp.]